MYLLEANVGGVLAEALAADVQAILADDGCVCVRPNRGDHKRRTVSHVQRLEACTNIYLTYSSGWRKRGCRSIQGTTEVR